jgi:Holliday junction resolvasome RuvABC endonuclease subunit
MTVSIGIDPSTKTGYVVLRDVDNKIDVVQYGEINFPKMRGMARVQSIGQQVRDLMEEHPPDVVVIEGYAFANKHTLVTLTEIQTSIRLQLHAYATEVDRTLWGECQPSMLKKFTTGKGTARKDLIMLAVFKHWQFEGTDNECDAFGLAAMGLYAAVPDLQPAMKGPHREAVQEWRIANRRMFD